MAKKSFDLDDILENLNERESKSNKAEEKLQDKVKIGEVENYFQDWA